MASLILGIILLGLAAVTGGVAAQAIFLGGSGATPVAVTIFCYAMGRSIITYALQEE